MIKDLVNPTNFNLLVSNIGDVLVKALDAPLGYVINWAASGHYGPFTWKLLVVV